MSIIRKEDSGADLWCDESTESELQLLVDCNSSKKCCSLRLKIDPQSFQLLMFITSTVKDLRSETVYIRGGCFLSRFCRLEQMSSTIRSADMFLLREVVKQCGCVVTYSLTAPIFLLSCWNMKKFDDIIPNSIMNMKFTSIIVKLDSFTHKSNQK